MKMFFFACVTIVVCIFAIEAGSQQKGLASKPDNLPTISAGEKYYAVFLAHQDADNTIPMSHTFAVFMKTRDDGTHRTIVDTATINWLPLSGHVSIARPAEQGVNKSLAETLQRAKERNLEVSMSGPYEIDADFYQRAVAQVARLDRGEFKYRCHVKMRDTTKNCIYAVADIFDDEPQLDTGTSRGRESLSEIVEHFRPKFKSHELILSEFAPVMAELKLSEIRTADAETVAAE